MSVRGAWLGAAERLARSGNTDPRLEAEVLLRHAMQIDRGDFFAALGDDIAPADEAAVTMVVERRASGEPLAYILGSREFYGLDFAVGPSVLVPRQETELLVESVLDFARGRPAERLEIADVGTGSGAIAVAIASHLPRATVYATDSSHDALLVADVNRRRHMVSDRAHLLHGDLLGPLHAPVDVIVSNPPYLTTDEMEGLPPDVRMEPPSALHGGRDGLEITGRLLSQAPAYVRPGGLLLVEIAPHQLGAVLRMGKDAFPEADVSFARDLMGLPRVVSIGAPPGPQKDGTKALSGALRA